MLNKITTFIKDLLITCKGLPLWQIALMIILPDVIVMLYILIVKVIKTKQARV